MSTKANPAAIGAFVVGAVVLAIAGLLLFGSGKLFKKTTRVVCFFSGDLTGLNVGAPVKFKGVDVGSVAEIRIRIPEETAYVSAEAVSQGVRMPVLIDIDNDTLAAEGARGFDLARLKDLIVLGLRAQLVSQSLVTGLLLVQLDFHPDNAPTFMLSPDSRLPEVPTVPTSLEQIQAVAQDVVRRLEALDLERLLNSATEGLEAFERLTKSPGLQQAIAALPATVTNVNDAVTDLRGLLKRVDRGQGPLLQSLRGTSERATIALDEASGTLRSMRTLLAPGAPLAVDLGVTLRELAEAAHSVRLLADTLDRNPSAIVRGTEVKAK